MPSAFIRGQLLAHFSEAILELGHDPGDVFSTCNVSPDLLSTDELVPTHKIAQLIEVAVQLTNCQHFGLLCAKNMQLQDYGALGQLLKTAPTFGDALRETMKHLQVNSSELRRTLSIDGDLAWMSSEQVSGVSFLPEHVQFIVAVSWRFNSLITQGQWHPRFVSFKFDPPPDAAYYRRFFSLPVMFGGEFDGVAFDASDLNLALPGNDPLMHGIIDTHVQTLKSEIPVDFLDTIKSTIAQQLSKGDCSIDRVVESLPYEKRSLQRRLKERGTSYQELLDDIRFDRAIMYLRTTDRSIENISDSLGYKNSSVFSKAFKLRFGTSPNQWKKNCVANSLA